ncbi:hypothetical protein [Treponema sp.]|uniref:hypothetical protein n=1 Tax=Treponema sp. TaxID=166 RepID=UPI00298EB21A|nr:hypothetical protein [Treponema sp.]MCQ2242127.1 hypothetical protein [Treponema sp.]
MAYVNFKELKEERPARNFDKVDITEDFDIGAQDGDSLYGTFSFFHGIKSFFKKVMSAASTLVSGKILMSDENGNVAGITPSDLKTGMDLMNSEDVNNALANYTKEIYLAGNYDTLEDAIKAVSSQALPNTLYTIRFEQNGVHIGQFYSYSYKAEVPEFGMGTAIKFNGNAFKFYVDWNTHQWVINNA